jgi:hypothetical protein
MLALPAFKIQQFKHASVALTGACPSLLLPSLATILVAMVGAA